MYAMVNVSQYQIVATGSTVAECEGNYRKMLLQNGLIGESGSVLPDAGDDGETVEVSDIVSEIRGAVINGNTTYYVYLDENGWFSGTAADVPELILLNEGDRVTIRVSIESDGIAQTIYSLKWN